MWSIFEDIALYVSRFEPHTLSFEITPPGPLSVGQKIHAIVVAGRRKVEAYSEVTEIIHGKKVVETHVTNNFFRKMVEIVILESTPDGTLVNFTADSCMTVPH